MKRIASGFTGLKILAGLRFEKAQFVTYPLILIILIIILVGFASAGVAVGADRYAGEFLTLGVGARPLGMGGSYVAIADDSTAAYWNPAGLGQLAHTEIGFMHSSLGTLDSYDFINLIHPIGRRAVVGLSWHRVGIDDIPITRLLPNSSRPEIEGVFSNVNNAFVFSGGGQLGSVRGLLNPTVYVGGNLKLIYITALRNSNALGVGGDVGLLVRVMDSLSAGVMVQDALKTKLYWNTPPQTAEEASHTDVIRPNVKLGVAYGREVAVLNSRIVLTVDADSLYDFEMHYGAEYTFADLLSFRVGLTERSGVRTVRLLTAGAGVRLTFTTGAAFSVDYAFLGNSELGNSNRISLMTRF